METNLSRVAFRFILGQLILVVLLTAYFYIFEIPRSKEILNTPLDVMSHRI